MPGADQDPSLFWQVDEASFAADQAELEAQGINVDVLNEKLKEVADSAEKALRRPLTADEKRGLDQLLTDKGPVTAEEFRGAFDTMPTRITRTSAPHKTRRQRNAERPAKKSGKTPKLEDIYRDPIRHGLCKIVRERGKAPRIIWL